MHSTSDNKDLSIHTEAPGGFPKLPETPKETGITQNSVRFHKWREAFTQVLPIYIATHLIFLFLTYTATLFLLHHDLWYSLGSIVHTLSSYWYAWDTVHFMTIARSGYPNAHESAFFPLYPLLTHGVMLITGHTLFAGLLVANIAGLGTLVVLYRLIDMDFGGEIAWRSVLYFTIFPTAFFLAAAYSESLFFLLVLLCFYYLRRGHWWLAGVAAILAALTRATAVALFIPCVYEYLRQHDFQWRKFRLDVLSCFGAPAGIALFSLYCAIQFGDPLSFSHAEHTVWNRTLMFPGESFLYSIQAILVRPILNFYSMHNVVNLGIGLFMLAILVLSFVGPWKFAKKDWAYPLYGVTIYLFTISVAIPSLEPLDSLDRYLLGIFPAFIVLAAMGKHKNIHMFYILASLPVLSLILLLFLTGYTPV